MDADDRHRPSLELRDAACPSPARPVARALRAASLNRGEFVAATACTARPQPEGDRRRVRGGRRRVGPGVTQFKPGDRVMGRCAGAFAEFALMESAEAMAVPEGLSLRGRGEHPARVPRDLRHAGAARAGCGRARRCWSPACPRRRPWASLQLGKARARGVIGTSGSQQKLAALASLGLDLGIATRAPEFAARVLEATDNLGADLAGQHRRRLAVRRGAARPGLRGPLATVGHVDGVLNAGPRPRALHAKRLTLFGVSNKLRNKAQRAAADPALRRRGAAAVRRRRIRPQIDRVMRSRAAAEPRHAWKRRAHRQDRRAHAAGLSNLQENDGMTEVAVMLALALAVACSAAAMRTRRLPRQADPPGDRLRAGRRGRLRRARHERAFSKALGQPGDHRQQAGQRLEHRRGDRRQAAADGYTVLIASPSSISVNPALNPKLGYTPSELAPVTKITTSPLVLAVHPRPGIRSVADLVAAAKKDPGKLNYSSSGNRLGAAPGRGAVHQITGAQMTHVPIAAARSRCSR
jgi:NADPH:quinone reductase-like Zn-dependent oxidoreductase